MIGERANWNHVRTICQVVRLYGEILFASQLNVFLTFMIKRKI